MFKIVIISSTDLVTRVPSSAYHLLASLRPQEAMSYHLPETVSQLMGGSTIRSKVWGIVGPPEGVPAGSLQMGWDRAVL